MYSTDVIKDDFYIPAPRSGLGSGEIAALKKSIPDAINLRKLKINEALRLVVEKRSGKSRVVAYKLSSGKKEYIAYRISDTDFYKLGRDPQLTNLAYPKPPSARLSSSFNPARVNPVSGKISPHNGIDYSMPMNTAVISVISGTVMKAEYSNSMGYYVEVAGKAGVKTRYLHLNKILVMKGQRVSSGSTIALSGNSGRSSGPHLHYELLVKDSPVDSLAFQPQKPKIGKLEKHVYAHIQQYERFLD
ncbi:putative peptidase [Yersinia frederiksenii]|nr:putative peptidase [Yersinia frederiksenii]CNL87297.1 putative peptidase [Yersinia frederiksenii]